MRLYRAFESGSWLYTTGTCCTIVTQLLAFIMNLRIHQLLVPYYYHKRVYNYVKHVLPKLESHSEIASTFKFYLAVPTDFQGDVFLFSICSGLVFSIPSHPAFSLASRLSQGSPAMVRADALSFSFTETIITSIV